MIVDTHVHVVAADQDKYPRKIADWNNEWVADTTDATMLRLMGEAGIDRTMLVQAWTAYEYDNSYAADCAIAHPDRFAGVCIIDSTLADAADTLSYWVRERGMRGLRLFAITDSAARSLDDPRTFPVWERAAALAIPICVCTRFRELPRLRSTIERFPDVTVALDHLGLPRLDGGPPYASVQPLFDLARMPNVYLKFSTVNMDSSRSGSSTPRAFFDRLLEHFGSHRMMWGSNFPATHDRSLREQFALARNELAFLSDEDQRWIFGETALSLWPSLR